jgi:hypothetical protein
MEYNEIQNNSMAIYHQNAIRPRTQRNHRGTSSVGLSPAGGKSGYHGLFPPPPAFTTGPVSCRQNPER